MVGLKYDTKICQSNGNFLHINKIYRCILCSHVAITPLPVNSINGKHEKYHLKIKKKIANNNVNSTFELKRKLDWCLELISVMWKWNTGIASSFLGDIHLICSYSRGYRIKKSEKDVVYFQPEENHKTRIAKSEKVLNITGSKTSWKLVFFLIFYAKQKRLKHQGKTVRQSVIPGNFKEDIGEAHTILAYCYTESLCSRVNTLIDQLCLNAK